MGQNNGYRFSSVLLICVVCYIYLALLTAGILAVNKPNRKRTDFLESLLGGESSNDIKSPPNYDSIEPVNIDCELLIDSVDAISEVSMIFKQPSYLSRDVYDHHFVPRPVPGKFVISTFHHFSWSEMCSIGLCSDDIAYLKAVSAASKGRHIDNKIAGRPVICYSDISGLGNTQVGPVFPIKFCTDSQLLDFTLSVSMHLRWLDERLGRKLLKYNSDFKYMEFDAHNMEKLWVPDIFFPNEKKASFHNVMMENRMLRLYQDGVVSYSTRISLILSCPMDLRSYPFDKQVCSVKIESFGYTEDHLILRWANDSEPVKIIQRNLPQFEVQGHTTEHYTEIHRVRGNHSCLRADFYLVRNIGHYVIQMYIPSLLIVMLSWVSFWLNVGSVPGRISLGVLSVLTISTQSSSVNASLPQVSYTKAIDVWMATCLVFVFAALIEFAVANVLTRSTAGKSIFKQMFTIPDHLKEENENVSKPLSSVYKDSTVNKDGQVQLKTPQYGKTGYVYAMYLDIASRVFFPAVFAIFNLVYWIYYLNLT